MKKKFFSIIVIAMVLFIGCYGVNAESESVAECHYVGVQGINSDDKLKIILKGFSGLSSKEEIVAAYYNDLVINVVYVKQYNEDSICPTNLYLSPDYTKITDNFHAAVSAGYIHFRFDYNEFHNLENKVSCGTITDIPKKFPELTSMFMTIIQIAVPVVLVIMGSLDLFKGIMAQKEDEIKKGQNILVKRLIVAALVFFVFAITKILVSFIADSTEESNDIVECMDCFLSGSEHCKIQFKEV